MENNVGVVREENQFKMSANLQNMVLLEEITAVRISNEILKYSNEDLDKKLAVKVVVIGNLWENTQFGKLEGKIFSHG